MKHLEKRIAEYQELEDIFNEMFSRTLEKESKGMADIVLTQEQIKLIHNLLIDRLNRIDEDVNTSNILKAELRKE